MNIIETTNKEELENILSQCNEYANIERNCSTSLVEIQKHTTEDLWYCDFDELINDKIFCHTQIEDFLAEKIDNAILEKKSLTEEEKIEQGYIKERNYPLTYEN